MPKANLDILTQATPPAPAKTPLGRVDTARQRGRQGHRRQDAGELKEASKHFQPQMNADERGWHLPNAVHPVVKRSRWGAPNPDEPARKENGGP